MAPNQERPRISNQAKQMISRGVKYLPTVSFMSFALFLFGFFFFKNLKVSLTMGLFGIKRWLESVYGTMVGTDSIKLVSR